MSSRTPLETRIAKKVTKAITDFDLIEDGDRVMVPGVKNSMLRALANVQPRHLLDTRLNPVAELRASAATLLQLTARPT